MLKYVVTAAALKCFSAGPYMPRLYRSLGNLAGNRWRGTGQIPSYYLERLKRMIRLQRKCGLIHNGDRVLELGTGWMHWEAITSRLLCDTHTVLFDVWDNRQLGGLKNYAAQLGSVLKGNGFELSTVEYERAGSLIGEIAKVNSFEELYRLMDFEYMVESSGSLTKLQDGSFQFVVSGGVLEHVSRDAVPMLLAETARILKPGGWALHSIDLEDHLSHYDGTVSKKLYLEHSERSWRLLYENKIQYINRLQRSEWLSLFKAAGLELADEDSWNVDISSLKLSPRYATMDRCDLECGVLRVLLKKPTEPYIGSGSNCRP